MNQSTISGTVHFSSACSLAALGLYVQEIQLFEPIRHQVHIPQKAVKDHPIDKVYDLWIGMLAGLRGVVELDSVLRADPALQRAFGRSRCAEQSVVQQTLDACTEETIEQMRAAMTQIARTYGQAWQPHAEQEWLLLDVDLSALTCGKQAEGATKGYFPGRKGRRGRQVGRVYASFSEEIVAELLYEGHTHLSEVLKQLIEQAEANLQLDEQARRHTLIRFDAGGGTIEDINWLLVRGYGILGKEFSGTRAKALGKTIQQWITDPAEPGRRLGIVQMPCLDYVQPQLLRRLVIRTQPPDPKTQPTYSVVVCNLAPQIVFTLLGQKSDEPEQAAPLAQATLHLYDQRGGGVETSYKGDKTGLGLSQRNKKSWCGQQMLILLASLAHNVLIWARSWLFSEPEQRALPSRDDDLLPEGASCVPADPQVRLRRYGIKRLVRDVLHLSGCLHFRRGKIVAMAFNQAAPLAPVLAAAFRRLLAHQSVVIILDQI